MSGEKPEAAQPDPNRKPCILVFLFKESNRCFWGDITDVANDGTPIPYNIYKAADKVSTWDLSFKSLRPGQIYRFERTKKAGEVVLHYKKKQHDNDYLGMWRCEADVREWQANHAVQEAEEKAKKAIKTDAIRKYHLEALDDLRKTFNRLPAPGRSHLIALIIQYLYTKPTDKPESDDD